MGASNWLVAGLVPGVERQPLKKLKTDEHSLLALLERWCGEAVRSGYAITRIVVAYEAGRDGFGLRVGARPSALSVTFSNLMPRSSLIAWPPVRIAMSCNMAFAAITETGRLHRRDLEPAAQLVDHESGQRLAFHVFGPKYLCPSLPNISFHRRSVLRSTSRANIPFIVTDYVLI